MNATRREFLHDAFLAGVTAMVASRFGSLTQLSMLTGSPMSFELSLGELAFAARW